MARPASQAGSEERRDLYTMDFDASPWTCHVLGGRTTTAARLAPCSALHLAGSSPQPCERFLCKVLFLVSFHLKYIQILLVVARRSWYANTVFCSGRTLKGLVNEIPPAHAPHANTVCDFIAMIWCVSTRDSLRSIALPHSTCLHVGRLAMCAFCPHVGFV